MKAMLAARRLLPCALFAASLAGCSSEGDIVPKKERFTPPSADASDDGRKPRNPEDNCVKPGTPNNERGVGGYCEPGRGDCQSDEGPRFCTADFKEIAVIDDNKWFCSTVCTMDEECGTDSFCVSGVSGRGCAPLGCGPDAGSALAQGAGR
jgi:hypothetical protein